MINEIEIITEEIQTLDVYLKAVLNVYMYNDIRECNNPGELREIIEIAQELREEYSLTDKNGKIKLS